MATRDHTVDGAEITPAPRTLTTLALSARFDRSFFWEGGASVRYFVARLRAVRTPDHPPTERMPLNIALVIDASGSMADGKLEAAKAAALGLVGRLTDQDRLTLVSFATDVQVHLDGVAVTQDNLVQIQTEVSSLTTRGMTNLSGGWFAGVDCAARVEEADPRMVPRVILLSDGQANEGITDPGELREHAAELRLRGVLTSALGIGDGYDELLLRGIAESGGGRLHDAELTSEISSVLLGELDDIFGTLVEGAQISLNVPAGVHVEVLGKQDSVLRDGCVVASLGPIQSDIERVAVFKVTCPAARGGETLHFTLDASGRLVADAAMLNSDPVEVSLMAADGTANARQQHDPEFAEIVARTWSAHIVAAAARLNRDRAFDEARGFIIRELGHFRRYVREVACGPELTRELELLAKRASRAFSPRMRKEMVVQSSLLMESRFDHRGAHKEAWSTRMERGE
jgi:Ca-activated chloride channel family protein